MTVGVLELTLPPCSSTLHVSGWWWGCPSLDVGNITVHAASRATKAPLVRLLAVTQWQQRSRRWPDDEEEEDEEDEDEEDEDEEDEEEDEEALEDEEGKEETGTKEGTGTAGGGWGGGGFNEGGRGMGFEMDMRAFFSGGFSG